MSNLSNFAALHRPGRAKPWQRNMAATKWHVVVLSAIVVLCMAAGMLHSVQVRFLSYLIVTPSSKYEIISLATARDDDAAVRKVLAANPRSVEFEAPGGERALHIAASYDRVRIVEALIQAGANVDAQTSAEIAVTGGFTPLHFAALGGHAGVAELLVRAGCRLDLRAANGKSARDVAAQEGHSEIVSLIDAARAARRPR